MRYLLLFVLLVVSCQEENGFVKATVVASKVDSLNTPASIEKFIHHADSNYTRFKLRTLLKFKSRFSSSAADSIINLAVKNFSINKSFYKEDFDNNGFTDLLVIGDRQYCQDTIEFCHFDTFVLLNYGKDSVQFKGLVNGHGKSLAPQIIYYRNQPLLNIHSTKIQHKSPYKTSAETATLIYKFDDFVELNNKHENHKIEKIEFSTTPCFGICPVYQINIEANRKGQFLAKYFNFNIHPGFEEENQFFTCTLSKQKYDEIFNMLNYLNFETLDNEYAVGYTDAPGVELIITYDNGKIKKISDYGQVGSFGLVALYKKFGKLRFSEKWKPAKEPDDFRINKF